MFKGAIVREFISKSAIRTVSGGKRYKENSWAGQKKKKSSVDKALEHFDDFYGQVFKSKWSDIRKGLLAKHKYVAVVNNYSDVEEVRTSLENRGAINIRKTFEFEESNQKDENLLFKKQRFMKKVAEIDSKLENSTKVQDFSLDKSLKEAEIDTSRLIDVTDCNSSGNLYEFMPATKIKGREDFLEESEHYKYYKNEINVDIRQETSLDFPSNLDIYCHTEENLAEFPQPKRGSTNVLNYYLMDGGSILPVLALDLKPGNKVLDMCCAPGGKSLLAVQTLYPDYLVCNDVSISRSNRIKSVLKQYLYDLDTRWLAKEKIKLTNLDGREIVEDNFDRILVDVPCTTDRHSLKEEDNNIFRPDRIKERLQIPELQSELLFNALKLVRMNGIVVYSTCSLSPIQNDGVVHMALKKIWEETNIKIVVKDLSIPMRQFRNVFKFAPSKLMRYGELVVPCIGQNFGPTYFCKLQKV